MRARKILVAILFLIPLLYFSGGRAVLAGMVAELSGDRTPAAAQQIKYYLDEKFQ